MDKATIINFVKKNMHKFNLKTKNNKILLNSQKSINCLYKLLNDDYLSSDLTKNNYEAIAKKTKFSAIKGANIKPQLQQQLMSLYDQDNMFFL